MKYVRGWKLEEVRSLPAKWNHCIFMVWRGKQANFSPARNVETPTFLRLEGPVTENRNMDDAIAMGSFNIYHTAEYVFSVSSPSS